ncbi:GNAT family N-acetyltransferase [Leifsonia sp. fls2-241-R2A-40a]|uniref:GNAT family N-acetyltransferase n=1 Tax=Leifsonia sp. fls2-241-R2A-40a TaxID=3040290 RepID=UPI00254A4C69|nr:GNAT family N-acetyltransferase [Leifsonia sp. fls2-241-R2A-40a]
MAEGTSGTFEYPDEAGYPDGTGTFTETQRILVEEVEAGVPLQPGIEFFVVDNTVERVYEAISGDTLIGGITYDRRDDVVTVISTSVYPEFRGQGVATALIGRVLEMIQQEKLHVRVECPIVTTFIRRHPEYEPLLVRR